MIKRTHHLLLISLLVTGILVCGCKGSATLNDNTDTTISVEEKRHLPDLNTEHIAGTYERRSTNGEISGELLVYPTSDSTALVYLHVKRGAPSYNSGSLYGTITPYNDHWKYVHKDEYEACEIHFQLVDSSMVIETVDHKCGFGYGVRADGTFEKTGSEKPEYFIDREGTRVYFSDRGN